ncbi:MAG: hypothetical protein Q27BPR15_15950 [Rhodobacter sp. CACIA14H1]|nr:MAG: hypothetical protein Q27BPR15_15950 [Rhodobacter sp. CACIA14H1]
MSMAEPASEKQAKKTKTRKTESQRLAAHRAYCASSEDRKREAGLERLTIWLPSNLRDHFKTLAADACDSHLRCAGPPTKAPAITEIIAESTQGVATTTNPALMIVVAQPKAPRNKKAKQDPRQLSLFETPSAQEGGRDGEGR